MRIIAVLDVDEEQLKEMDSNFEKEMGWVEQSGIHLVEYHEETNTSE